MNTKALIASDILIRDILDLFAYLETPGRLIACLRKEKRRKEMTSHTLFMLTPWKKDGQGPYYCPDCGVVEGFFAYSPGAKVDIDIVHEAFARPRTRVVEALGEENQGCPVLVLAKGTPAPPSAKRSLSTGAVFIDDAIAICNFLGRTYGGVLPHP